MEASGIQPVQQAQQVTDPIHTLRVNQRITAEILNVAADHVTLALEGFPVVARLTSADQLAQLENQKSAQFIVRDSTGKQLLLQMVQGETAQPAVSTSETALIAKLLSHFGIAMDQGNVLIAQQLIKEGLPITPESLAQLRALLEGINGWGEKQAETAVQMMKAGIPLSQEALKLILAEHTGVTTALHQLQSALQSLQGRQLPPDVRSALDAVLAMLNQLLSQDPAEASSPASIQSIIENLGSTLENRLLHMLSKPDTSGSDLLLNLVALRASLQKTGQTSIVHLIDQVLSELQFQGMNNIANPGHSSLEGNWFSLCMPFFTQKPGGHQPQANPESARLRISYHEEGKKIVVDPANTHLKLNFPMGGDEELVFDLVLADSSISARIGASSESLQAIAEQEIPPLQAELEALGYEIHRMDCLLQEKESEPDPGSMRLPGSAGSGLNVKA